MDVPADTFQKNVPGIKESDATSAAIAGRTVQSFNAHPLVSKSGLIETLAVKLKLSNGAEETILIGRYSATVLRTMLSHLEDSKWTELSIISPEATP